MLLTGSMAFILLSRAPAGPDWPMWRFDVQRSGRSPVELSESLHLHWTLELPEPRRAWPKQLDDHNKLDFDISYEPVVARGLLFVPSMVTDSVAAYDLNTGKEQWIFYADGPVRLAPVFGNGRLYFGSDDGRLYCLEAATGKKIWSFEAVPSNRTVLGNERLISMWPVRGAPVLHDGTVYFAAGIWPFEGIFLYALDAESAEVEWSRSGVGYWQIDAYNMNHARSIANIAPQGYLAVDGDHLIVSGGRTTPGVYNRHTGRLLKFDTVDKRDGGYAISSLTENYLLPLEQCGIQTGSQRQRCQDWSEKVEGDVCSLLAAAGRIVAVTRCGRIHVFGPEERTPVIHTRQPITLTGIEDVWRKRVADLLEQSGEQGGYGLMFGIGCGRLLDELLMQSDLHIIAFDPNPDKVRNFRERYVRAGLYGVRVAVRQGGPLSLQLPPYIASVIVSEDKTALGNADTEALVRDLYHPLRPYGGIIRLPFSGVAQEGFVEAVKDAGLEKAEIQRHEDSLVLRRPGPLPGSDIWGHQYADAANSGYSDDCRVRPPLGLAWFGGTSNEKTLPRHMFGPKPQVAGGRLVILGVNHISARCVYTGREVWARKLPDIGGFFTSEEHENRFRPGKHVYFPSHHGANFVGSPYVTAPDSVYLIHDDRCLRYSLATGNKMDEFKMPGREVLHEKAGGVPFAYASRLTEGHQPRWGRIAVSGDTLVAAAYPHVFDEGPLKFGPRRGMPGHWNRTSSEYLLTMDRETGDIKWVHHARYGFRHNAIAAGKGRVFVIDNVSEEIQASLKERGVEFETRPEIRALDLNTGELLWAYRKNVFGTWLSYSSEHDVLIQSGRPGGRCVLPDEPQGDILALRGVDGEELWRRSKNFFSPLALHEEQKRVFPVSLDIATGELIPRVNPVTGKKETWRFLKQKGCGTFNLARYLMTYRSSMAAYHDLLYDSGTAYVSGVKAGCTENLIVADGILNVPDYTRTCSCAYQLQTSAGLVHNPDVELWTVHRIKDPGQSGMRQIGLNLGAPGDRIDNNGTLWAHIPQTAPSLALDVDIKTDDHIDGESFVSMHSLMIDEREGTAWVAASASIALTSLELREVRGDDTPYRVTLHFAELENAAPGERCFDIKIGNKVLREDFDVVRAAGGANKAVTLQFEDVLIGRHFHLELIRRSDSGFPPTLSGVELRQKKSG